MASGVTPPNPNQAAGAAEQARSGVTAAVARIATLHLKNLLVTINIPAHYTRKNDFKDLTAAGDYCSSVNERTVIFIVHLPVAEGNQPMDSKNFSLFFDLTQEPQPKEGMLFYQHQDRNFHRFTAEGSTRATIQQVMNFLLSDSRDRCYSCLSAKKLVSKENSFLLKTLEFSPGNGVGHYQLADGEVRFTYSYDLNGAVLEETMTVPHTEQTITSEEIVRTIMKEAKCKVLSELK